MLTTRSQGRKQPRASEQSAVRHTQALAECRHGRHTLSPTFRPGEHMCLICGFVFYCPTCLKQHGLFPMKRERVYPLECLTHQRPEVPR